MHHNSRKLEEIVKNRKSQDDICAFNLLLFLKKLNYNSGISPKLKLKPSSFYGQLHAAKKSNVLLTWVYTFWNGYQTDRNWTLNQDQEKNFEIFAGKKFVARKTAKNGIFGHFWGIFGTFACKILKLESWNFASTFVLIEWSYTRKKNLVHIH